MMVLVVICCNRPLEKVKAGGPISGISFQLEVIDSAISSPAKPYGKAIGDLDSDGQPDLLISSALGEGMFWYQYPDWKKYTILAEGSWSEDCQIFDIDQDGDNDIVNGNQEGLYWYENTLREGDNGFDKSGDGLWIEHFIGSDGRNIHDLEVADLNGDGKPDIVVRYEKEYELPVSIFLQDQKDSWRSILNTNSTYKKGEGLALADLDHDGDTDIIIGYIWLENNGQSTDWTEHQYALSMPEQILIKVADLNNDGNKDIVVSPQSTESGNLSWYAFEDKITTLWTAHSLATDVTHMHGLALADFNLDGYLDIHTSIRHDNPADKDHVSVWLSHGKPALKFEEYVLDTGGSHFSKTADIDQDGDIDIFGANWTGDNDPHVDINLWINQLH